MPLLIRAFLGFVVLGFCFLSGFSQDINADINRYEEFFSTENRKSVEASLRKAQSQLQVVTQANDMVAKARALQEIGLIHLTRTNNYEQAMDYLIQALAIEDSLDLKDQRVFTYLGIAQVFENVGDYYKSAQFLEQALTINEKLNNDALLMLILNKLGKINASLGKIDEAFENYHQVLEFKDMIERPEMEADALFNLAHLYQLQGKYKEALENYKHALAIRRKIKDRANEALSLNDIGELYRLMRNEEKALANHVAALEMRQGLKDKRGIAESYGNIGALYYHQKNFQRAIDNLQLGLQAGQEAQAQNQILKIYDYLNQCYKELGDYKKALEYKELYVAIHEFTEGEKSEQHLLETQNRYSIGRKESQITKLESDRIQREKELGTERRIRNFLFVLTGLGIVIFALVFYLYITKRRSNKTLEAAHEEVNQRNRQLRDLNVTKDKFFSIISHDLKGPLNSLTSFSGLLMNHLESLSKEEIQMLAKDLDKSLKNLFALLENLLEWSRSQTGNIDFKPEAFSLGALLEENKELLKAQAQNKKINIVYTRDGDFSIRAHKQSINTVVRNLLSNAIKFTPEGGTITLTLNQNTENVIVSVTDTGVGISAEVMKKLFRIDTKHTTKGTAEEKGTGLGLILCKEFVEKNGGKIWVESEAGRGSVFHFSLPAN